MSRRFGLLACGMAGMLLLGGCAQADAGLTADAGAQLQTMVVSVAETAATGDHTAALADVDELQAALDAARDRGDVSDERAATIQAALDQVRADLLQASEPAVPSAPVEVPGEAPVEAPDSVSPETDDDSGDEGSGNDGNNGNGNDGNNGNGNNGSGNGNGNRNGVSGGRGES
jgi:hypothetical protein